MNDRPPRSVLFLPASNPRAIDKARSLACDAVVLDLEDATAPGMKEEARRLAVQAVRDGGFGERTVVVRVNALDTVWGAEDLAALAEAPLDIVLAPKVGSAGDVREYAERLPVGANLWVMIETCRGVVHLPEIITGSARLCGLVLGTNDLSKDMRRPMAPDRRALHHAMSAVVTAARACGLVVIDGVFNGLDDAAGLAAEAAEGRAFGFDGKSLIHPSQIEPAKRAFSPSDTEVAWAREVIDVYAQAGDADRGALRVAGTMVEGLHLEQARRILQAADG